MASAAVLEGGKAMLVSPLGSGDELEYLSSATLTRRKDFIEAEEEVRIDMGQLTCTCEPKIKPILPPRTVSADIKFSCS